MSRGEGVLEHSRAAKKWLEEHWRAKKISSEDEKGRVRENWLGHCKNKKNMLEPWSVIKKALERYSATQNML